MKRRKMPSLRATGRHYLEGTRRARLASPGIERHAPARGKVLPALVVVALVGALVAGMVLLR